MDNFLKIKKIREEKKFSVSHLAGLVGISRQTMYSIESGKSAPSLSTLRKIAECLEVPYSNLLDETVKKDQTSNLAQSENWYQSEISRLNRTVEMLSQSLQAITSNLGKFEASTLLGTSNQLAIVYGELSGRVEVDRQMIKAG